MMKKKAKWYLVQDFLLYKDGKELLCLMTNYHVIEKKIIQSKTIINIKYKYEKELFQIK